MSCSPFDLKDYVFGELAAQDARSMEGHLAGCRGCHEELERLRLTHSALLAAADEEIPRRIAFVSDKLFEPSLWQRFWQSGPRLGFASAAMLALAILAHGYMQPAAPNAPVTFDQAAIDSRIEAEVARRLPAVVENAMAVVEQRQGLKLAKAVSDSEKRLDFQRRADLATVEENFVLLTKQVGRLVKDSVMASVDRGAVQ